MVFEYKLNKILNEKFIGGDKGIKQFYNSVAKEYDFDAIAFVGGTSNVIELRNKVCEALNIDKIDGEYKNGQAHTIRKDGQVKNVKLFFTSETGGEITCSNAVAMGALLQQGNRQETSRLISRPDIYLQLFGSTNNLIREIPLYSSSDLELFARSYNFKLIYESFKQDNPDKEYKIKFKIKQVYGQSKEKVFPKKNYFSIALSKEQFGRDVDICFIVHKMGSGEMHYTGSLKEGQPLKAEETVWGRYCIYIVIDDEYNSGNGQRPNIDLCYAFTNDEGNPDGIVIENTRATLKEFKCYDIAFSQGDGDGNSRSYGWCSPLNKEGLYDRIIKEKREKEGKNL